MVTKPNLLEHKVNNSITSGGVKFCRWLIGLLSLLLIGQVQAGERSPGSTDTSRRTLSAHGHPTHDQQHLSAGRPDLTLQEQTDPAVRQFWSDKCVNQRSSGRPHSRDCDSPAYSGSGYGWVDPYRYPGGYRPSYPGGNTVIINRGGTVVVPQQYGGKPPTRGGLMPLPRR